MSDIVPRTLQAQQNPHPEDEIDLKELLTILWGAKALIVSLTGLAATISVVFALSLPNIYTAGALLAPVESSSGGLSGLMKQYGGIARLAGVSLPTGGEGSRAQLGMQLLKSRAFIGDFVERRNLLPDLMAVDSWDPRTGELIYNPQHYDDVSKKWIDQTEFSKSTQPSAQSAYKAFLAALSVSQNPETGYVTVHISHRSPKVAADWVEWLVNDVNIEVKNQDVAEAEKAIDYLKAQVEGTSLADMQAMFFELIQAQTEIVMLAEVRPEYVFKTIDPAVIPEEKSKPSRAFICIVGTFLGGVIGIFIVLMRHYMRSDTKDSH